MGRRGFLQAVSAGGALAALAVGTRPPAAAAATATAGATEPLPPLPQVRVTPPVVHVSRVTDHQVSLDGTWSFAKVLPDGFTGRRAEVAEWDELQVPGHFALQGFGRMYSEPYVPVGYHRTFEVPADWAGQRVVLRFAEVDGLAEVWVNGTQAGSSDSCFLPSEFDITDLVVPGEPNELAVAVSRSELTSWAVREMGGITEPVTLQVLPTVNLARLHVGTVFRPDGGTVMRVHLRVANQSGEAVDGARVQLRLRTAGGRPVPLGRFGGALPLPTVPAGEVLEHVLDVPVPDVARWDPDHPNLHVLQCTLRAGRLGSMTAERRFGFCTVEVDGVDVFVNGAGVKLRGANTHYAWPGFDFHPPTELMRRDVEIFRDANLNYLRPRLTAIPRYVAVCDEVGMLISMDASMTLQQYNVGYYGDRGGNDRLTEPYLKAVATMVETHLSSPSVVLWSTANECLYWDYFQAAAVGIQAVDIKDRPVSHSADQRVGIGIPGVTANDDHYPNGGSASLDEPGVITGGEWELFPEDRPIIFTEWCHVHMYNKFEQNFDPGIFDYWGHYVHTHTEYLYATEQVLGSVIFTGSPLDEIVSTFDMGFFDNTRRLNDSHWHTLKASSPVRLSTAEATRDGAALLVPVENRYEFTDLSELEVTWTRGERSGRVRGLAVAPRTSGELRLPVGGDPSQPVEVEFRSPRGYLVERVRFHDEVTAPALPAVPASPVPGLAESDTEFRVDGDGFTLVVDRRSGRVSAAVEGREVLRGGPSVVLNRTGTAGFGSNRPVVNMLESWVAESVTAEGMPDGVRITTQGRYSRAVGGWTLDVRSDGLLTLGYRFEWTSPDAAEVLDWGAVLGVASDCSTLSWERQSLWSAYPDDHIGRPRGSAPLAGDPRWDDARQSHQEGEAPAWPWSQDIVEGASRDFRSTKANVTTASLLDGGGTGVVVLSDGGQNVHAYPDAATGDISLAVNAFYNGGTDRFLESSVRIDRLDTAPGTILADTVRLLLTAGAAGTGT
ncbi:MAG: sugar-binding domain-containing protein [Kineosporiaceae bacterium]